MRARLFIATLFLGFGDVVAQTYDTLNVMTYNLLFYGENTTFCDNSNNPIDSKDEYFKTIVKYSSPDILVVNEMGASATYANRILNNVLNVDGQDKFKSCSIKNNSFSSLVNGMFYNSEKVEVVWQRSIKKGLNNSDLVRVIDINKFYYKDDNLEIGRDTTYFYVAAAHLKAGNSISNENDRRIAAEAFMEYISTNLEPGYFFLCGDLNLYSSNEDAFQEFTGTTYGDFRLFDLASASGNWHNTAGFSDMHTQSTRLSNTNSGCFSGGGMDDRFDFILASGQVYQDTGQISYLANSYRTCGQDGNHFNQELTQGGNTSVPSNVLEALYEMSDHLPVMANVKIQRLDEFVDTIDTVTGIKSRNLPINARVWIQNEEIRLDFKSKARFDLIDINGQILETRHFNRGYHQVNCAHFPPGIYFARITTNMGASVKRLLILR